MIISDAAKIMDLERRIQNLEFMLERMSSPRVVCFKREDPSVSLPRYATVGSAGLDLESAEEVTIEPGARALISTGWRVQLPAGTEGQIRPRSGLAFKHGITVLNSPGTIDNDYTGVVKVLLMNQGTEPFRVRVGDRIAQLVVSRMEDVLPKEVMQFAETDRGDGGFGSTGVNNE